jgi:hypothetical protein
MERRSTGVGSVEWLRTNHRNCVCVIDAVCTLFGWWVCSASDHYRQSTVRSINHQQPGCTLSIFRMNITKSKRPSLSTVRICMFCVFP